MSYALLVAGAADDIRDIRGRIELPAATQWALLAGIALAALVLLYGVARLVRARVRRAPSAYAQAKARLERARLEAQDERGDVLAERVSGAVREYVEARFALRAAHSTSEDFLNELLVRADSQLSPYREQLERFLSTCDLAKFAGRDLSDDVRSDLCIEALRFVDAAEQTSRGATT